MPWSTVKYSLARTVPAEWPTVPVLAWSDGGSAVNNKSATFIDRAMHRLIFIIISMIISWYNCLVRDSGWSSIVTVNLPVSAKSWQLNVWVPPCVSSSSDHWTPAQMTQPSKNGRVNHTFFFLFFCKALDGKICWKALLARHEMFTRRSVPDMFPTYFRD